MSDGNVPNAVRFIGWVRIIRYHEAKKRYVSEWDAKTKCLSYEAASDIVEHFVAKRKNAPGIYTAVVLPANALPTLGAKNDMGDVDERG